MQVSTQERSTIGQYPGDPGAAQTPVERRRHERHSGRLPGRDAIPLWLLLACLLLVLNPAARAAEAPILNIYNWADYIDPDLIDEFSREYGIKVNYDVYDSSEIVDTKLMTGHSGYDVVIHSSSFSARLIPIGVYRIVDTARLQNWHNIDSTLVDKIAADYGGELAGVPYMWGTTGFTYNRDLVLARMPDAPLASGAMIFDPAVVSRFADCGVSLLDDPTSVIPMAMLYLGHPANSVEPEHLRKWNSCSRRCAPISSISALPRRCWTCRAARSAWP
ncbi:MAG: extracellular solute-binding protein [Halioglobus sp.]